MFNETEIWHLQPIWWWSLFCISESFVPVQIFRTCKFLFKHFFPHFYCVLLTRFSCTITCIYFLVCQTRPTCPFRSGSGTSEKIKAVSHTQLLFRRTEAMLIFCGKPHVSDKFDLFQQQAWLLFLPCFLYVLLLMSVSHRFFFLFSFFLPTF